MKKEKSRTVTEAADKYIKRIKGEISDCSAHEKNGILLEKLRYWVWSAIDWREREMAHSLKNMRRGK